MVNAGGTQVGHIPRQVAEGLARLLDGHVITVEGRMVGQNLDGAKHYKLGMDVSIYCRPAHREILLTELSWAVPAARPQVSPSKFKGKGRTLTGIEGSGSSGVGLLNAGAMDEEMRRLLDGLKRVGEDEKQADSVMVGALVKLRLMSRTTSRPTSMSASFHFIHLHLGLQTDVS